VAIQKNLTNADEVTTKTKPIVELRQISMHYGHIIALENIDFCIMPNEIHALVGDNGSGKSTLIKIISGAIKPISGELYFEGEKVNFTDPGDALRLGVATLYQDLALVGSRNIYQNLFLGREISGRFGWVNSKKMSSIAKEMLSSIKQMNITDVEAKVSNLSGGQRQAVAIGRAMHWGSKVLLLDEPAAALGIREAHEVLNLIMDIKAKGQSILIVAHNLTHVFRIADSITVLRGGRIVGTVSKNSTDVDTIIKMITGTDML
jgi:ABC-type sugar transport system ATPase subunit